MESVANSGSLKVLQKVLMLVHLELTALFSPMGALAGLVVHCSFPFLLGVPVVFREALEAHSSQPLHEVEAILFHTMVTRCSVVLRVVLLLAMLFKSIAITAVVVVIVMELKLVVVVKCVALLFLMLKLPVVGCDWRVRWEASIHVCCLIHASMIKFPVVVLWVGLLVVLSSVF